MAWPSIRDFLGVPDHLTGRGVTIAVLDGSFTGHPDIADRGERRSAVVHTGEASPELRPVRPTFEPWPGGAHGLWTAAAAGGSGASSGGAYPGIAPDADLLLVTGNAEGQDRAVPDQQLHALRWLRHHAKELGVRGVLTAVRGGRLGPGPWQADPLRIACEQLSSEGLLVVAGTGNAIDSVSWVTQAAAPSTLSVGGVIVPAEGGWEAAPPYHGCRGTTFEGSWTPAILAPAENLVLPWVPGDALDRHVYAAIDDLPRGYARTEGTSHAGPILLGAAACVWQVHPGWTAQHVREALVSTARRRHAWESLRAGLVDVEAAAAARVAELPANRRPTPFERYSRWREGSATARFVAAGGDDEEQAVEALLSYLPEVLPDEAVVPARLAVEGWSARRRAAGLWALATRPDSLRAGWLLPRLADSDPCVRAAALHALRAARQLWGAAVPQLTALLTDPHPDVCQAAVALAGEIGAPSFVEPLVGALAEDLRRRWLFTFFARTEALERLTGVTFEPDPP